VLSTTVKSAGDLSNYNRKDPAHAQRSMQTAARVAQAVQKAQGKKPAKPITMEEMQAQLQKDYAACKGDQACLMAVAMKASEMTTQLYAQQAPADAGDLADEEESKEIFFDYFGYENCGAQFHILVDESGSGQYADVGGSVPFSHTRKADYRGNDVELSLICSSYDFVIDTEKKMMWTDGFMMPGARGTSTYEDRLHGKTVSEGEMPLRGDVIEWVNEQIRHAPLSGTRKATLALEGNSGAWVPYAAGQKGSAEVEMTWRFEDI
jgi:hypothetical protein